MLTRRDLLRGAALGAGALALPVGLAERAAAAPRRSSRTYRGPNVILVRFGGGVRRRESIDPSHSYAPYLTHELIPQGTVLCPTDLGIRPC